MVLRYIKYSKLDISRRCHFNVILDCRKIFLGDINEAYLLQQTELQPTENRGEGSDLDPKKKTQKTVPRLWNTVFRSNTNNRKSSYHFFDGCMIVESKHDRSWNIKNDLKNQRKRKFLLISSIVARTSQVSTLLKFSQSFTKGADQRYSEHFSTDIRTKFLILLESV